MHIFTKKAKAKHDQTPRDIYFNSLEEAYGNLPVPSDDWADIKSLLEKDNDKNHPDGKGDINKEVVEDHINKLTEAVDVIKNHYITIAEILNKEQKYG